MKSIYIFLIIITFCSSSLESFCQNTKVWNFVFEEESSTYSEKHHADLDKLVNYLGKNATEDLVISLEGRFESYSNHNSRLSIFKKRVDYIKNYFSQRQVVQDTHFGENQFIFSKNLDLVENIDTSLQPSQLVRVFFNFQKEEVDHTTPTDASPIRAIQQTENISALTDSFPNKITLNCSPTNNRVVFRYRCGQTVTLKGHHGAEVQIAPNAIKGCEDGMMITATLIEPVSIPQLVKELYDTRPSGKKYYRTRDYLKIELKRRNEPLIIDGGIKVKLLLKGDFDKKSLAVKRNKTWRVIQEPTKPSYQNNILSFTFYSTFQEKIAFGVGDMTKEKIYIELDNWQAMTEKSTKNPSHPYVVYDDGSVVFIKPAVKSRQKMKHWKYFEFPVFEKGTITGTIYDHYILNNGSNSNRRKFNFWEAPHTQTELYELAAHFSINLNEKNKGKKVRKKRFNRKRQLVYTGIKSDYILKFFQPAQLTMHYGNRWNHNRIFSNYRARTKISYPLYQKGRPVPEEVLKLLELD